MIAYFSRLWRDDNGALISAEYLFVATILILGIVVGLAELRYAINEELSDLANSILSLNQRYNFWRRGNDRDRDRDHDHGHGNGHRNGHGNWNGDGWGMEKGKGNGGRDDERWHAANPNANGLNLVFADPPPPVDIAVGLPQ